MEELKFICHISRPNGTMLCGHPAPVPYMAYSSIADINKLTRICDKCRSEFERYKEFELKMKKPKPKRS